MNVRSAAGLLLILCLAVPAGGQNGGRVESAPTPDPAAGTWPAYTVGPADVLDLEVYDNPDLCGDFTVDAAGEIDYPLLGRVRVAGLSAGEIEETLRELLERDYLHQARVTARVKEYKSRRVEIRGDVGKPGVYYLDGPLRLLDLLVRADGISSQLGNLASHRQARIAMPTHPDPGTGPESGGREFTTTQIGLRELLVEGRKEANLPLHDGYVVYIPKVLQEESTVHVLGEVNSRGSLAYEDGMTVLRAITLANGATKKAVLKKTFITREQDGEILEIPVRLEDVLLPGDILTVPTSFW